MATVRMVVAVADIVLVHFPAYMLCIEVRINLAFTSDIPGYVKGKGALTPVFTAAKSEQIGRVI